MARQPKVKVELINSIPSDPAARARLAKVVSLMVQIKKDIADAQESLKIERTVQKESHHISPKFLNALVNREYDVKHAAEKKTAALEETQELFNEADILMGRGDAIKGATPNLTEDDE